MQVPTNWEKNQKCILRGANTNGNSDSITCIAGSISGAYLGIDAILPEWIENCVLNRPVLFLAPTLVNRPLQPVVQLRLGYLWKYGELFAD